MCLYTLDQPCMNIYIYIYRYTYIYIHISTLEGTMLAIRTASNGVQFINADVAVPSVTVVLGPNQYGGARKCQDNHMAGQGICMRGLQCGTQGDYTKHKTYHITCSLQTNVKRSTEIVSETTEQQTPSGRRKHVATYQTSKSLSLLSGPRHTNNACHIVPKL
jgi:hypothetical protein